ncbi:MAG: glycosyltransferase family 2 protein [Xanthomonadales bacterium]|nr:glycosyltransferase family 2 protein [Xanthomonadales bacterium]
MSSPRVSVVMAAHNAAATLPETLASIEAQTRADFEIVVVDDGSSDATPAILEAHAASSPRCRWVRQANAGVAAARSHAIGLARGELVAFIDADDPWLPRKLEKQLPLFDDPAVGLVYCDVRDVYPAGDAPASWFHAKAPARGAVLARLFAANFVCTSSVVVRKAALLAAGGFDPRMHFNEDYDLWLRLANEVGFDYVDEVLVRKRALASSLTHINPLECHLQDLRSIDHWVEWRPDLFPRGSALVRRRRARALARIGYHRLQGRDFRGAREAYWQALTLGQVDAATALRFLAALSPPLARTAWWAKALRRRMVRPT